MSLDRSRKALQKPKSFFVIEGLSHYNLKMHHRFSLLVKTAVVLLMSVRVFAGTDPTLTSPKVIAVQSRGFSLIDEITAQLSYMPLDSFNRYMAYGASYTHYFNGYEAWEILNICKANNYDSGLTSQLQKSFLVSTFPFNTLDYFVTTNFVYTPFFNKSLLMDSKIIRGETAFVGGGGLAKFDNGFVNMVDLGAIFRFFMSSKISVKFDIRYHFYFSNNAQNNLQLGAGLSYALGADDGLPSPKDIEKVKDDNDD